MTPEEDPLRASGRPHELAFGKWPEILSLETPRATFLYWLGVALVSASVLIPDLLPCVDYPQHLALADVLRRLTNPAAPEHAEYYPHYWTYNTIFHVLVSRLSFVLPVEVAGKLVVMASLATLGASTLALVRKLSRPPIYAALFTPILFSFSVGWGFINYAFALSIATFTLVIIASTLMRPTALKVLFITALGLLCSFAHVLAMILLCVLATAMAPEVAWRATAKIAPNGAPTGGRHAWETFKRMFIALSPLIAGSIFCALAYRFQYNENPVMWHDPKLEGTAPPLWQKFLFFGAFASDLYQDGTDQIILFAGVAVSVAAVVFRVRGRRNGERSPEAPGEAPLLGLFIAATFVYLATPTVLLGTHLIFERLGQAVIFGMVFATPRFPARLEGRAAKYAIGIALVAGVNTVLHTTAFAYETNDASHVIDELPEGRKATAVIYDPGLNSYRNGTLTHIAGYYGARKHGDWAFGFARYLSVPVRFKWGAQPPWPAKGWEFNASNYNPRCGYARVYNVVIVKAPDDYGKGDASEARVRKLVFGQDANVVKRLSHHGYFWAFDTAAIPPDGTY